MREGSGDCTADASVSSIDYGILVLKRHGSFPVLVIARIW
jgi:hypothetical protein